MPESQWKQCKLGELFSLRRQAVFPAASPDQEFYHHSLPAWDEHEGPVIEKGAAIESSKTLITGPCVLFSKLNPRKPRVSVVEEPSPSERHCASTEFVCLQPKVKQSLRFWGHYLSASSFSRRLERHAIGSTNSHTRVNPKATLEWSLSVPPQSEQRIIAHILDTLDTQIRRTEEVIAKLEQIKQGLLTDLLTRGIDDNGELRPSPEEAPHLYKDSPLGRIPSEWSAVQVAEIADVKGGKRLPAGHDYVKEKTPYKYLRVTDFFDRSYLVDDLECLSERTFTALDRYEIRPGDLYISIAGSLGHVGLHKPGGPMNARVILTENAARLVLKTDALPDYLALAMNNHLVQMQIDAEKGTGGGVPKLALFRIEKLWLALPTEFEQRQVCHLMRIAGKRVELEKSKLRKLRMHKIGLMDDLLTGRVRVTPLLEEAEQAVV